MEKKTRAELIALCKERGKKGYSKKTKSEIVNLLLDVEEGAAAGTASVKKTNASPLRYPGGKTRAVDILYSYVRTYFPGKKTVLSPFFGGGSFELFLTTKKGCGATSVRANDLFEPLYAFWSTKKSDCANLVAEIESVTSTVTKETFARMRAAIMTEPSTLKKAVSYFIINRASFSGSTLCGGYSEQAARNRLTESSIRKLRDCDVSMIEFTNLDCNAFLDANPETEDTLVYADPPYYIDVYIYGKNGNMHENFNHAKFAETIQKRKDWIVSYNDCAYIRDLYKNCRIFEAKWSYGMNASKASSEIVIIPPPSRDPLEI